MRKTKLNARTRKKIVEAIKSGNTNETAARLAGISEPTFYNWLAKGRDEEAGPFKQLLEEVEQAQAEAESAMVEKIKQASYEDWKAAAWYLERRKPQDWGRKDRLNVENQHSGTIRTEHEQSHKVEVTHMLEKDPSLQDLYMQIWERQQLASAED